MNRHRYDPERASALLPLLRSITAEVHERTETISELEAGLARLGRGRRAAEARQQLESGLSVHRRELRAALRELGLLGCKLDADHPLRVLIPGADGDPEHGWSFTPSDGSLRSLALAER
jgi:hypothetical protein